MTTAVRPSLSHNQIVELAASTPVRVHERFEAHAAQTPGGIAVVCGGESLSYGVMNERANRLARLLRRRGVGRETRFGICIERSIEMTIAVLAVLKAGGAYVPLDPTYPVERLAFMLEDAGMAGLLTTESLAAIIPLDSLLPIIRLDADRDCFEGESAENLALDVAGEDLAYIIYTSGSTGRPKGVMVQHQSLDNLIAWQIENSRSSGLARPRTLQFTSLNFDISLQEMFATWGAGATLVLVGEALRRDPAALWRLIVNEKIERLFLPPAMLHHLAEAARRDAEQQSESRVHLREVIVAGEQPKITPAIREFFAGLDGATLENHYGPTETCIIVTALRLSGNPHLWAELPSVGRPITNAEIYILDAARRPLPDGETGELYIGGICLTRGYLNRPELTAERFVKHPFDAAAEARLYRTGDLARRLPNGEIQYLGRADNQVKIRGYRIEPGEIEVILAEHSSVSEACVVPRDVGGDKRLVAYVVPREGQACSLSELIVYLRKRLPAYMIPAHIVVLDALPLSPSGKIDRARLPAPAEAQTTDDTTFTAPRDETETRLQSLWEELLDVPHVGIRDDFFRLGGDSLLAVAMLTRADKLFDCVLTAAALLPDATIEHVAEAIALARSENPPAWSPLIEMRRTGQRPPLFFVHPIGGEVYGYGALARALGEDQPFYGIQARGLDGRLPPFTDLSLMASYYIEEIRRVQPSPPYILGGYSLGGTVAFEMARQLEAQGARPVFLAILDEMRPSRQAS
jgi:amino acid adenylation domain-containing protein